jgi:zinc protease
MVIGEPEHLDAVTWDDVKSFFEKWYRPDRMLISLSGNFSATQGEDLVRGYFESIPAHESWGDPSLPELKIVNSAPIQHEDHLARRPRLTMAWHVPAIFKEGDAEASIAAATLWELEAATLKLKGKVLMNPRSTDTNRSCHL